MGVAAARGRPKGSVEKPWRQAVEIALKRKDAQGARMLQKAADALVDAAIAGDVSALKEIGDRLDGKPAQAVVGDDNAAPIKIEVGWASSGS